MLELSEATEGSRSQDGGKQDLQGSARGLAYVLSQSLGNLARKEVSATLTSLGKAERAKLRKLGATFGETNVYMATLLKPRLAITIT